MKETKKFKLTSKFVLEIMESNPNKTWQIREIRMKLLNHAFREKWTKYLLMNTSSVLCRMVDLSEEGKYGPVKITRAHKGSYKIDTGKFPQQQFQPESVKIETRLRTMIIEIINHIEVVEDEYNFRWKNLKEIVEMMIKESNQFNLGQIKFRNAKSHLINLLKRLPSPKGQFFYIRECRKCHHTFQAYSTQEIICLKCEKLKVKIDEQNKD